MKVLRELKHTDNQMLYWIQNTKVKVGDPLNTDQTESFKIVIQAYKHFTDVRHLPTHMLHTDGCHIFFFFHVTPSFECCENLEPHWHFLLSGNNESKSRKTSGSQLNFTEITSSIRTVCFFSHTSLISYTKNKPKFVHKALCNTDFLDLTDVLYDLIRPSWSLQLLTFVHK